MILKNVILQLKKRYKKEIIDGHQSPLKRVLHKDMSSSIFIILCISSIIDSSNTESIIELTDGWYGVECKLDVELSVMLKRGLIYPGQKLCISDAKLDGVTQGIEPLDCKVNNWEEGTNDPKLQIYKNSTSIAQYNRKLGYQKSRLLIRGINELSYDGGKVSCIEVCILRKYPQKYLQKVDCGFKFIDEYELNHLLSEYNKKREDYIEIRKQYYHIGEYDESQPSQSQSQLSEEEIKIIIRKMQKKRDDIIKKLEKDIEEYDKDSIL